MVTGSVQGQDGWGFEQPDLVKDVPAHGLEIFKHPFQRKPFYDSMIV